MDDLTKEQRHKSMSHIKSTNTMPEERVRKYLFSKGFRYRKNVKDLPGKPDIVLPKYKTVVFVNGCFWHMHDCGKFKMPSTNVDYWEPKLKRNVERDRTNIRLLKDDGWNVIVVWECELKKKEFENTMKKLQQVILAGNSE